MRLDVYLTPGEVAPPELSGRTVVILDILRATSTIVQALSAGAKSIYPVASIEEALRLANTFGRDEVLLCGERKCVRIEGFDLGNSPREFTAERVAGKTLVMTTTNGTNVMALATGADEILVGSLLNAGAVVDELVSTGADPVILCAAREKHLALEDATCAGFLAARIMEARPGDWELNDGGLAALALARELGVSESFFRLTGSGQTLIATGYTEDLAFCTQVDLHALLPVLHDRHITIRE